MYIGLGIWVLVASVINAGLYWWDKRASIRNHRRIPERTLLVWSIIGGWPGGLLASRSLRHKTKKVSYRTKFVLSSVANVIVIALLVWMFWR